MKNTPDRTSKYRADSLSLIGAVALGTGVMIDTSLESPLQSLHYQVPGRAVVVLVRDQDGG